MGARVRVRARARARVGVRARARVRVPSVRARCFLVSRQLRAWLGVRG